MTTPYITLSTGTSNVMTTSVTTMLIFIEIEKGDELITGVRSCTYRVKSGYFGHQVNSNIYLQTVEIQMRRPSHQDFH